MLYLLLPPCGDFVDCSYLFTDKASPPPDDVWFMEMARLVALRYGGESASASGCLCDGTGALYRLFSVNMTILLKFACSGKAPVLRAFPL